MPYAQSARRDYSRPLAFEPNRGQTAERVDFLAHAPGYNLFLSHGEAVMKLVGVRRGGMAVRVRPLGANLSTHAQAFDPQPGKSNYFIGNNPEHWHTKVPNFAKVRYANICQGVDLIYYGNEHQVEYDFIVQPGASSADIVLQFEGPNEVVLDSNDDLVMITSSVELRWHKPVAYQQLNGQRVLVACGYVRQSPDTYGFRLGAFDTSQPLIHRSRACLFNLSRWQRQ